MVTTAVTSEKQRSQMRPKDKWCPMARLMVEPHSDAFTSANRFIGAGDEWMRVRCLGEACAVFVGADADGHCGLVRG